MELADLFPFQVPGFVVSAILMKPLTIPVIVSLIIMLVLLFFSALISGAENSFFSLTPAQLKSIRSKKNKTNSLIAELLDRPKRLLATILIANNFINVSIVVISVFIFHALLVFDQYPVIAFIIQVVVVTSLILILGEIMPKIYSASNPLRFANFMARSMNILIALLYPFSSILVSGTSFIDKRLGKKNAHLSMSELSEAINLTSDESTKEEERKILKGIVKFGDTDVKEIMKSRMDVTAVDITTSYYPLLKILLECGYSRIPVYQDNFDKISGILYVKDLLPYIDKADDFDWPALLRPAFFVPENKKISDLLQEFQKKKIHMAIVVDEYGGTSGIVTMEDIIEEIVGEISDEFDTEEDEIGYTRIDDKNYLFEGKTLLNDFCKILNIDDTLFDEVKGDSETLAGLILEIEGKIPKVNDRTKFQNFEFRVKKMDNRRIAQVLVTVIG